MLALASASSCAFHGPAPMVRPVGVSMMAKSQAFPNQAAPAHLEGYVGNVGFDPLGLSSPQNIKWMREAELEHGRVCMLAWTGYVAVDLGIKFPGEKYASLTSFTAHDTTAKYELFLLLLLVGTAETIKFSAIYGDSERAPGDFGFDPLKMLTPATEKQYKEAEIQHCRLAMMAFAGVVTQSAIGHPAFPYV